LNYYFLFIDLLILVFIAVMGRHLWKRMRYILHMFQQSGYKIKAYAGWMWAHWGSHVIPVKHGLYNLVILILLLISSYIVKLTNTASILVLVIFALFWFSPADFYGGYRPKKPLVFTPRLIRLTIPFVLLCLVLPYFAIKLALDQSVLVANGYILAFGWILADIIVPFLIFPAAILLQPVERMIHNHFKRQARRKIDRMENLTVIALTGSYGKTTTKFLLRDILKERFNVLATPGSYNTPMGICKVINNDLKATHQVVILEMGARHRGNIKELCKIAPPDITIVTTVGVAHLETFGSRRGIAQTKQEIIENMNSGGLAVLNADNEYTSKMKVRDDVEYIMAGTQSGDFIAKNIYYDQNGCSFSIDNGNEKININMPLLGAHNVYNMLFATIVARKMGLRIATIELAAPKVEQVEHRLELKKNGELYIIDDAFNSNPTGAKNAVEILSKFTTGRRIIITPGMIELGEIQEEENRKFGEHIARANLDLVILVGRKQSAPILKGIEKQADGNDINIKLVDSLFDANKILEEYARPGDVILYENDLPDTYSE